jgi:pimeloyl-ACP methyl ester carboxylesterase
MATIVHSGIRFSYLDRGEGAPIVLQHGMGGDATQPASLYSGPGRLICLECRGHGHTVPLGPDDELTFATFADDLLALLDHLGLGRVLLGGISMGAGVAMRLAAAHIDRVRGLVLVRPAWFDAPWPEHLRIYRTIAELLRSTGGEAGKTQLRETADFQAVAAQSPATAHSLLSQFDRMLAQEHAPVLERLPADYPLSGIFDRAEITVPSLVLGTRQDPTHPWPIAEAVASALPDAELHEVTPRYVGAARHAAEVTAAIQDFTSSSEPWRRRS